LTTLRPLPLSCPDCGANLLRSESEAHCTSCSFSTKPSPEGAWDLWPSSIERDDVDIWWKDRFDQLVRERGVDTAKVCEYYDEDAYQAKRDRLLDWVGPQSGKRLIDVGCGPGMFAQRWVSDNHVVGVDQSMEMVRAAANRGLDAIHAPGDQLPFPKHTFDGAILIEVMQAVSQPLKVLFETIRVVKPGGFILLSSHNGASVIKRAAYAVLHNPNKAVRRAFSMLVPYHDGPAHHTFSYARLERDLLQMGCRDVEGLYFYLPSKYVGPAGNPLTAVLAASLAVKARVF
jgi:SAM-dependent methyltransferase